LLNVPNFSVGCVCNYPIQTSFAMYHLPGADAWLPPQEHSPEPAKKEAAPAR
jgi:hypothetical protein